MLLIRSEKPKGRGIVEDVKVGGRVILKWIINKRPGSLGLNQTACVCTAVTTPHVGYEMDVNF